MAKFNKAKAALSLMGKKQSASSNKGSISAPPKPTTRLKKIQMKEMNKPLALQVATQSVIKQRNQNVIFQEIHDDLIQKDKEKKQAAKLNTEPDMTEW